MKTLPLLLSASVLAGLAACSNTDAAIDDLTSITARERVLTFEGYVYAHPDASREELVELVHMQTRSAFGALTTQNISTATRELKNIDPNSLVVEPVVVVDDNGEAAFESVRVHYVYTDRAVVPKSMAHRSALSLGLLHGDYPAQAERILSECSLNTPNEREMVDDVWYVYNPSLDRCREAMNDEQRAIDREREQRVSDDETQVVESELDRLYIPMTARLEAVPSPSRKIYPEYDRLWTDSVTQGQLTITLLNGMIDHAKPGETHHPIDDAGYIETLDMMDVILQARPNMNVASTEPTTDLGRFQVNGTTYSGLTFRDFIDMERYDWGYPAGMKAADKKKLRELIADRLTHRWIIFEEPVAVSIGGAPAEARTIQLQLYFGVEEEHEVYKRAVSQSDVFLYNGHSYIGEGPLDPENFTKADFPNSYQIFFIDSCLSFNYYNQDYFAFKDAGTLDLDVISNGLESFSDGAGAGQGRFVRELLSGTQPTYLDLLEAAETSGTDYAWGKDALRVVDGELDNVYKKSATAIAVTSR
jgi:hypothetical protein